MNLLTLKELAERWNVEYGTVRQWRARGLLPEPDLTVANSPAWYEKTIDTVEVVNGRIRKSSG